MKSVYFKVLNHFFVQETRGSMSHYMEILVEFVLAMMDKMKVINENSYNDFQLKVGKWLVIVYRCIVGCLW